MLTHGGDENLVPKKGQTSKTKWMLMENAIAPTFVERSSGIVSTEYRLPTEAEWEYELQRMRTKKRVYLQRSKKI
jgi:hypothetical protein